LLLLSSLWCNCPWHILIDCCCCPPCHCY
jgi:hypothetical protein